MPGDIRKLAAGEEYKATTLSFLIIRVAADPDHPKVAVDALLDGAVVATAMAFDATLRGVPDSSAQSLTLPIPAGHVGSYTATPSDASVTASIIST